MKGSPHPTRAGFAEFVGLVSALISLTALSTDAMLSTLPRIAADLGAAGPNDRQWVVSMLFLGLGIGQLVFGPLSDAVGRKPAILSGLGLFVLGSFLSAVAASFPAMLAGRALQGFGIAASRAVTVALVRDRYEGRAMARVMSFVMSVFIFVPMVAPALGQVVAHLAGWRAIFLVFVALALVLMLWFGRRQPETLPPHARIRITPSQVLVSSKAVLGNRTTLGFTIAAGAIGGAHMGYLNLAQQVLQEQYEMGALFPLVFAGLALAIGLASFTNARLVLRFGMRRLVRWALRTIAVASLVFAGFWLLGAGEPPLGLLLAYLALVFFWVGVLFGNLNAAAMEPLGHVAGFGAAFVGALSTLIAFGVGATIGRSYAGSVLPLVFGLGLTALASMVAIRWAHR